MGFHDTSEVERPPISELLKELSTNEREGLSSTEAAKRLEKYGPNQIEEKKTSPVRRFLRYFWGPIPEMIEAAAIISAVIQHWADFSIIFVLLIINALVGFWQERKAGNAIELLKRRLALKARVLRDRRWIDVSASEIVPGDIIRLRLGNIVPVDARLIQSGYLLMDESALTGESLPVEKHQSDEVFSSSIVRQGEMNALATSTGMNTYFGRTTKLVVEEERRSHFQKAITKIGDYLIAIAVFLVALTFMVGLFRQQGLLDLLQFGLVLTVAAIPAALPAVLSVSMAVGVEKLARKEAIVSKLVAIEEMAGVDVLCADKTGTITKNELSVAEVRFMPGYTEEEVLLYAALGSREEDNDPIDNAVIAKGLTLNEVASKIRNFVVVSFEPFDPVSKRTEAFVRDHTGVAFHLTKGAPQAVLSLVRIKEPTEGLMNRFVDEFAVRGYRALGVAKTVGQEWEYIGLIALHDPPREDSAETVETEKSMGINVKMVTGDHIAIAKEVAEEVGLGTNIVTPSAILEKSSEAQRVAEEADGFAQVFPEHKYRIVDLLQKSGHIVCVTGDGVNDAPALKKADAGIAVAGATDAAKSAADVVLTKPGLSVIVDAFKESRKIFQRMWNYALYRINETIRVLFFVTLSILVFQFYPVTALMIVLLALLNDLPIMTIAYDNVRYSEKPERWNMRVLLGASTFLGSLGVISSFGLLYIGLIVLHLDPTILQSFIYLKLSVAGHLSLFVARTKGPFWSIRPAKPLLLAVILTQLTATLITVYGILLPAMGWNLAILVWGYSLASFFVQDLFKVRFYRLLSHEGIIFRR